MNWLTALPLALMSVRMSVNRHAGVSPFALLTGRLMPGPTSTVMPADASLQPRGDLTQ